MLQEMDLREDAPWKRRFRAWTFGGTWIARTEPDRGLAVSNRSASSSCTPGTCPAASCVS